MMRAGLLFGGDLSLQPCQRKLLFESAQLPIQCWLEHLSCGMVLELTSGKYGEEILLIRGELNCDQNLSRDTYLCIPPQESTSRICAAGSGATVFRVIVGADQVANTGQRASAESKVRLEIGDFSRLAWNEIPARREHDPGARTAELSANASRTRITTLMDCRPGWHLQEHNHPSDVVTFCMRGGGILGIEDESCAYQAGHLVTIPAGVRHRFETGPEGALLAAFVFEPFLF